MQRWEYLAPEIVWDEASGVWEDDARESADPDLDVLLAVYGDEGWELVSLQPERWLNIPIEDGLEGTVAWEAEVYRARFKRPVEA